jgi:hypothetical protein
MIKKTDSEKFFQKLFKFFDYGTYSSAKSVKKKWGGPRKNAGRKKKENFMDKNILTVLNWSEIEWKCILEKSSVPSCFGSYTKEDMRKCEFACGETEICIADGADEDGEEGWVSQTDMCKLYTQFKRN